MDQLLEFLGNHPFLTLTAVVLIGLLVAGEIRARTRKYQQVNPAQATRVMNQENALVLDVRETEEYRQGHIRGSRHIPLGQLGAKAADLAAYKDKPVLVYCRSGNRSAAACNLLSKQGFEDLYNLAGGILAWQNDNLPVKKK